MGYSKSILTTLLLCATTTAAYSDTRLDIHGVSKHINTDIVYNEQHLGVGISIDLSNKSYLSIGSYYNSIERQSAYITYGHIVYNYNDVIRLSLQAGLVSGYGYSVIPTAAPVISIGNSYRLNIDLIPPVEGLTPAVVFANISVTVN